ncbi:hypothetical protein Tco_1402052 [Tanacetum coccineum]
MRLEKPVDEKEVWEAVNSCGGDKAPRPDDIKFTFINRFWDVFKKDLIDVIKWFWDKNEISRGCNASFVTLIPKVADLIGLGEYRPISLVCCYYKIIATILVERIKLVIGKLVGEVHNAFIGDRFILDGILIANETVDFVKKNKSIEGLNSMIKEAVQKGIFKGIKVGSERRVSGLKVNLNKSRLYGVGVNSREIEGDALWARVIKSIYGESGGLEADGVGSRVGRSGIWRDIMKVGGDIDKAGIDFSSSFSKMLGDEAGILCKEDRVVDRGRWCEGVWRWEWDWVKEPRGRACGDVAELTELLQNVILTPNCRDSWRWNLTQDEDGNFKVKDLAFMVDDVCLKLDKRGIELCLCYDDSVESCDHSLWECGCSILLKSFVVIGNMDNRLRALTGFRGDRRKPPSTGRNGSSIPQVADSNDGIV